MQKYYTVKEDGLKQDWQGETVFCNPPYGRATKIGLKNAIRRAESNTTVVMLIPARTDTTYFIEYIKKKQRK